MVPTYDKFMFPVLDWLKDGNVRTNREAQAKMKQIFNLSDEDVEEVTPNGTNRFKANVNWALTFLYQAGLTTKPKNGQHEISKLGKDYLAEGIKVITEKELILRFGKNSPNFFFSNIKKNEDSSTPTETSKNPEEAIHDALNQINEGLIKELLDKVKSISPSDFEKLVVELLVKMGYGGSIEDAAQVTKFTGDEGIDGVIKEDVLGLDSIYIQAKHYTTGSVGRPELQAFVGALSPKHAKKGVFITTSSFSKSAKDYADAAEAKIILIDGYQLCKYMLKYNLGVSTREVIEVKSIDSDYFNFD